MTARVGSGALLVRDVMTADAIAVPPETSIVEARRLMDESRIRHLLVTRAGELVGIVTDRDVRLAMPSNATSLSAWELSYLLDKLPVGEVMTRTVITVGPERTAVEAARLMLDHKIGALPVIDEGRRVGILTETDVLRAFVGAAGDVGAITGGARAAAR